ncbi:hypothetical protein LXL04_021021 [Taraxacum kok-saghyz]
MCRSWNRRPEVGSAFSSFSDLPSETIPLSSSFPVRVKIDRTEKSSTVEQRRDLWVPTDKIHHRVLSSKSPKQEATKLGGATAEIMSDLLAFEADRRAVNITINSIGTELTREDRRKLYSSFGLLYPYGHEELAVCEDIDQVRGVMEKYPAYQHIFGKLSYGESQMLDKAFYEEEVKRLCLYFEQQFHYGVFFAYMRLREQEIRNLMWISECGSKSEI